MTDRLLAEGRDAYRHFTPIATRWMDNDVYGHVNNVVHYSWFDTAVNGMLIAEGIAGADSPEAIGLVVGTQCQYFEPISFPTPVEIGLRVARLGDSSVTYRLGVFTTRRTASHASGVFTHVYVDPRSRRPVAIPQRHRERLACYALPDA